MDEFSRYFSKDEDRVLREAEADDPAERSQIEKAFNAKRSQDQEVHARYAELREPEQAEKARKTAADRTALRFRRARTRLADIY
jgi:hypothetical protein